jgi:hypothetical protein
MMEKLRQIYGLIGTILIGTILMQCSSSSDGKGFGHHSVLDKINTYQDSVHYTDVDDSYMDDIKRILVKVHDTNSFFIPERTNLIKSFPCTNCHGISMNDMKKGLGREEDKHAHGNIKIQHASEETMDCLTCHDEKNINALKSLRGVNIKYDESYKQCAQCHSTQFKDWVGGAHGKRLGGYVPPRTINTCVNCHNPHAPAFEKRWPVRLNTVAPKKVQNH